MWVCPNCYDVEPASASPQSLAFPLLSSATSPLHPRLPYTEMAAWIRRSSHLVLRETTSFAKLAVSSHPGHPARLRTFAAVASKKAGSTAAPKKTAAASKPGEPRAPAGLMKPLPVSPQMEKFLGGTAVIPRTQALKEIWAYIKQNNLQDPANKRIIICDEKLKTIFAGKERVGLLEVTGLMNAHFVK